MSEEMRMVIVFCLVTMTMWICRSLPYFIFQGKETKPQWLLYLDKVLPAAIMSILVMHCLKNTNFRSYPYGLIEFISLGVVMILYIWKKSVTWTIVGGTLAYMILLRINLFS